MENKQVAISPVPINMCLPGSNTIIPVSAGHQPAHLDHPKPLKLEPSDENDHQDVDREIKIKGPFKCPRCPRICSTSRAFAGHVRAHHMLNNVLETAAKPPVGIEPPPLQTFAFVLPAASSSHAVPPPPPVAPPLPRSPTQSMMSYLFGEAFCNELIEMITSPPLPSPPPPPPASASASGGRRKRQPGTEAEEHAARRHRALSLWQAVREMAEREQLENNNNNNNTVSGHWRRVHHHDRGGQGINENRWIVAPPPDPRRFAIRFVKQKIMEEVVDENEVDLTLRLGLGGCYG